MVTPRTSFHEGHSVAVKVDVEALRKLDLLVRSRPIVSFLRQRPDWIGAALNTPILELLQSFDQKAGSIISNSSWSDGFTNGAVDA